MHISSIILPPFYFRVIAYSVYTNRIIREFYITSKRNYNLSKLFFSNERRRKTFQFILSTNHSSRILSGTLYVLELMEDENYPIYDLNFTVCAKISFTKTKSREIFIFSIEKNRRFSCIEIFILQGVMMR